MFSNSTPGYLSITKLEGTINYSTWKLRMKMVLTHQNLWEIIKTHEPNSVDADYDSESYNSYQKWLISNDEACSLILLMSSDSVIQLVQDITNAKILWEKYIELFGLSGFSARHNVFQSLYTTNLELCSSMQEYINKIKQFSLQLSEMNSNIEDWQIISILLNNLGPEYDNWSQQVIQALRESKETKLDSLISQLLDEDQRRKAKEENIALLARNNQISTKAQVSKTIKKTKKCTFCGKIGHLT